MFIITKKPKGVHNLCAELHNLQNDYSTIFKTFNSDVDKWTTKIGVFGKSFNELGTAISNAFKSAIENIDNFDKDVGFWESLKNNLFSPKDNDNFIKNALGEIISKENIDSYIKELDLDTANKKIQDIFNHKTLVDSNKAGWQDYFDTLKDGEGYIKDVIKNTSDLSKLTGEDLVSANTSARNSALAHNAAIQQQTLSAKAGQLALKGLAIAGNMLLMLGITKGIELIVKGIDQVANSAKYCKERVDEVMESFNSMTSEINANAKTISEIADRYTELSKHVNRLGENVSLTEDEFEEYHNITSKIAEMYPTLVDGWDAQGNAVINLKDALSELNAEYEKSVRDANLLLMESKDDIFKNYENTIKSINQELQYAEKAMEIVKNNGSFYDVIFDSEGYKTSYYNHFKNLGLSVDDMLSNNLNTIERQLILKIQSLKDEANDAAKDVTPLLKAILQEDLDYKGLSDELKSATSFIIDQIPSALMDEIVSKGSSAGSDFIEGFVDEISGNEDVQNAILQLFTVDLTELSPVEADKLVNSYISTIQRAFDSLGYEISAVDLKVNFGFDDISNLSKNYVSILQNATSKVLGVSLNSAARNGLLDEWMDVYDKLYEFAKEHSINTQDEIAAFQKALEESDYDIEKAFESYLSVKENEPPISFDITTYEKQIDDFQSKLKTLGDALSSIRSGDYSESDFTDLVQEFNELDGQSENLEEAIISLINNAIKELKETLGEGVSDDLLNSLQSITNEALGLSTTLHDAFSDIHDSWDILHDFKDTMDKGFDSNVTDSLLQSVRGLSGELETLVAGYYSGVVTAEQLYEALTQHYENDLHNYSEALIKKNDLNEEFYNAVGLASEEVTNQFSDDYDVDIKNCTTYNQAKLEIEKQTLGKISAMWSQYYDAQSKTLKMSMSEIEARATHGGGDAAEFLKQYELIENYEAAIEALNNITYEGIRSNFESIGSKLGANGSGSGSSSDFAETFDWIETAIERIERSISNLDLKASSVYRSWSERNSNLKAELLDVKKEMDIQASGYNRYMQQANSVGLSEEWASKVRNGQIDINSITDKALAEQIKSYTEYYEKAIACQDAVESLRESVSKFYETAFDNIVSQFDSIVSVIENSKSMLDEQISQAEERGYIANVAYYEALIKVEQKNIEQLTKERTSLQSALADAVNNGAIAEGSEEWASMQQEINDVTLAIEQANTAMIKYGNSIRDIQWQIFDLIQDRISRISSESDFLINLLSYDKQYDDRGQLTDTGMSTVGLHGMNYNVYMAQADKYAEEMLRINEELAKDPNNLELYNRKAELIELQQESIIAAENEKQAIVDMVEEGIKLELDAIQSLISSYEDALSAQKD